MSVTSQPLIFAVPCSTGLDGVVELLEDVLEQWFSAL